MTSLVKFNEKSTALEVVQGLNLKGKDAIVTGGAGGIGVEVVRALAQAGARVIIATRDLNKANDIANDIRKKTDNNDVEVEELELGSLKSINAFVSRYLAKNRPLHMLINNAALMRTPQGKTEDGFETQFGVNHVGHFALTTGLLPALKAAKSARVVMVSSVGHILSDVDLNDPNFNNRPYNPILSYAQSKTANILFAVGLTKRYANDGIYANAVMPGGVFTPGFQKYLTKEEMMSNGWIDEQGNLNPFFKTIEQGAATSVWAAVAPELEGRGGLYLEDCQIMPQLSKETIENGIKTNFKDGYPKGYASYAVDSDRADKLWNLTVQLISNKSA